MTAGHTCTSTTVYYIGIQCEEAVQLKTKQWEASKTCKEKFKGETGRKKAVVVVGKFSTGDPVAVKKPGTMK